MKKLLLLVSFFFISCGIPYDGETIVTINANLVDANNIPIENQKVTINSYGIFNSDTDFSKKTNFNGIVNFKMFQPLYDFDIITDSELGFLPVKLIQLNKTNFSDYNLNIGTITLYKSDDLTELFITTNQTTSNKILQKIEVDAQKYESIINKSTVIDTSQQEIQTAFELKKNQNFTLKYTLKNLTSNTLEEFQENLTVGTNPLNYTLTY